MTRRCAFCGERLDAPIRFNDGEVGPDEDVIFHRTGQAIHSLCLQAVDHPDFAAVSWLLWRLRGQPGAPAEEPHGMYL